MFLPSPPPIIVLNIYDDNPRLNTFYLTSLVVMTAVYLRVPFFSQIYKTTLITKVVSVLHVWQGIVYGMECLEADR